MRKRRSALLLHHHLLVFLVLVVAVFISSSFPLQVDATSLFTTLVHEESRESKMAVVTTTPTETAMTTTNALLSSSLSSPLYFSKKRYLQQEDDDNGRFRGVLLMTMNGRFPVSIEEVTTMEIAINNTYAKLVTCGESENANANNKRLLDTVHIVPSTTLFGNIYDKSRRRRMLLDSARDLQATNQNSSSIPANPNAVTRPFNWLIQLQGTCTRCSQGNNIFADDVSGRRKLSLLRGGGGRRRSLQEEVVESCTVPSIDVFTTTLNDELVKLQEMGNIVNVDTIEKNDELIKRTNACGLKLKNGDDDDDNGLNKLTQHYQLVVGNFDGNITGRRNMIRRFAKLYAYTYNERNYLNGSNCDETGRRIRSVSVVGNDTTTITTTTTEAVEQRVTTTRIVFNVTFECVNCAGKLFESDSDSGDSDGGDGRRLGDDDFRDDNVLQHTTTTDYYSRLLNHLIVDTTPDDDDDDDDDDKVLDGDPLTTTISASSNEEVVDLLPFCYCTKDSPVGGITRNEFNKQRRTLTTVLKRQEDIVIPEPTELLSLQPRITNGVCPSQSKTFQTTYIFSIKLMTPTSSTSLIMADMQSENYGETLSKLANIFKSTYNIMAQRTVCDKLFRTIQNVKFELTENDQGGGGEGSDIFMISANFKGNCRTDYCAVDQDIFDTIIDDVVNRSRRRRRIESLGHEMTTTTTGLPPMLALHDDLSSSSATPTTAANTATTPSAVSGDGSNDIQDRRRFLADDSSIDIECYCLEGTTTDSDSGISSNDFITQYQTNVLQVLGLQLEFTNDQFPMQRSSSITDTTICGNGIVEGLLEECDDGNDNDDDGCNSICEIERLVAKNDDIDDTDGSNNVDLDVVDLECDAYDAELIIDVLDNDCCGNNLRIIDVSNPTLGTVSITDDEKKLKYKPDENRFPPYKFAAGSNRITFTYKVINEYEEEDRATVAIRINRESICGDGVPEGDNEVCDADDDNCNDDCTECNNGFEPHPTTRICIEIDDTPSGDNDPDTETDSPTSTPPTSSPIAVPEMTLCDKDCGEFGTCVIDDNNNVASCECDDGYETDDAIGNNDGTCICPITTCGDGGTCVVTNGQATCDCDNGYTLDGGGNRCVCGLICGDEGTCIVAGGQATCDCNDGFAYDETNGICVQETESPTSAPTKCPLDCGDNGECLPGDGERSGGPTCICNEGYEFDGDECVDMMNV